MYQIRKKENQLNNVTNQQMIFFFQGGAVAIDLTCNLLYSQKIWCLIVENSFTSIPDMARILLGWRILRKLPLVFYKSKFF